MVKAFQGFVSEGTKVMIRRAALHVTGIVQGVGFRPYVYNLAVQLSLKGWVKNSSQGVFIEIEGEESDLEKFIVFLRSNSPQLARIEDISVTDVPPQGESAFNILESSGGKVATLISPDTGICRDCLRELFNSEDRRYRYPFINCTNCGPRYTIIEQLPYDRKFTTMKEFPMCQECGREFHDPTDRRFHAQPNACPECGPELALKDRLGNIIASGDRVWTLVRTELQLGRILAVKGLGGYHLCCDALNHQAVLNLRSRKIRWEKPFAVMMPDTETVKRFCNMNEVEEELLESQRRPILLLEKKGEVHLPEEVAPNNRFLGVMLPYTPMHYLLVQGFNALIMTSGNISDEPIAYQDEDALKRLNSIADFFLVHNRKIFRECDDSVIYVNRGKAVPIRRSRGYVPEPLNIHFPLTQILACGGEQKNTFCLANGNKAFLSQHIGDLENLPTLISFEESIEHYKTLFEINPEIIAYDLHPEYLSSKFAMAYPSKAIKIGVQHHHAHIASCLADNQRDGPVIGVSFDGTGYGTDGCLWGGEFLVCDFRSYERVAHLAYVPMPSGTKAIQEPWRMAASYLYATYGNSMKDLDIDFISKMPESWRILQQAIDKNINAPLTSSCGRLFDGVAALIGVRSFVHYEGQAAVELEQSILPGETGSYPFEINVNKNAHRIDAWEIDWKPLIRALAEDLRQKRLPGLIAGKFHNTVADIVLQTCLLIKERYRHNTVALSGGVFQNRYLLNKVIDMLNEYGFQVLTHNRVPSNDGGLSLGQALIAQQQLEKI